MLNIERVNHSRNAKNTYRNQFVIAFRNFYLLVMLTVHGGQLSSWVDSLIASRYSKVVGLLSKQDVSNKIIAGHEKELKLSLN